MTLRVMTILLAGTALTCTAANALEFEATHIDLSYSTLLNQADGDRIGLNGAAEYNFLPG